MSNRTAQEILMDLARRWAADDCTDLVLDMLEKVLDRPDNEQRLPAP